jgi:hypothetical protein
MAWKQEKVQPEGVKTTAGVVKLVSEEPSIRDVIRKPSEETWLVALKPPGSSIERIIGYIRVDYEKVGEYKNASPHFIYSALRENNLSDGDKIVYLGGFRPFQYAPFEPELREKGIGTAVLNLLLEDLKSKGAGVYCYTEDAGLKYLLGKSGFQKIDGNYYFKKM